MSAGGDRRGITSDRARGAARLAFIALASAAPLLAGCGGDPPAPAAERDDRSAAGQGRAGASDGSAPGSVARAPDSRPRPDRESRPIARRIERELENLRGYERPIGLLTTPTELREEPAGTSIERLETETEFESPKVLAVVGHRGAWLEVMTPELPNGATGWVYGRDIDLGGTEYELTADLGYRELTVRRRGRVVRRVTVAIGGPDTPTPTGTFAVTDKLDLAAEDSPYGCCALALTGHQPDVPQGWSGGDRLAVHATREKETIGTASSLGCLRAGDADMRRLVDAVPLGTPVAIRP
jgi:lipoprotein-anchoring transpeptidase ErfK/SrfK